MTESQDKVGTLNVVATPLGNLGDLTVRASEVLIRADRIYAEDTRRSRILLNHIGSSAQLKSLHEHNEKLRSAEVIAALEEGLELALISDAGTPAISDPGADLVATVAESGFLVTPIPGVSAFAAALSVAGFRESSTDVRFVGFLPVKGAQRKALIQSLISGAGLAVFYESPKRIQKTLREMAAQAPERLGVVARELTKVHEEIKRGTLEELLDWATNQAEIRGEITVVVGPNDDAGLVQEPEAEALDSAIRAVLDAGLSPRDAAAAVAAVLGLKKRSVYNRLNKMLSDS